MGKINNPLTIKSWSNIEPGFNPIVYVRGYISSVGSILGVNCKLKPIIEAFDYFTIDSSITVNQ